LFWNSKTQKYLLFFSGFVKFATEFSLPWLHWSLVITSYYSSHTSERQWWRHMTIRDVVRGWYELYFFIFVHILIYMGVLSLFM
jgi:hypothetical protein